MTKHAVTTQLENEPNLWTRRLLSVLIVLILLIWSFGAIQYKGLQANGLTIANNIITGILTPDTQLLFNLTPQGVPYLLLETLAIALLGTLIGTIVSVPIAFLAASTIVPKWLSALTTLFVAGIRTFPAFVYGLMFIRVTGPGPFAGVLTLSITSIGMITKLYVEAIEDIDKRILESLDAAGCTPFQKVLYGILPQIFTNFISTAIYRFEINIKDASILGLVGAGGIGAPLIFAMNAYRWNEVGAILFGLIILVLIVEYLSTKLRVKLARG